MLKVPALAAALSLALGACSPTGAGPQASGAEASGPQPSDAPAAAAAAPDACQLVGLPELSEIFSGRTFVVDTGSPAPPPPAGPGRNMIATCTFVSEGASVADMMVVTLLVTIAPSDSAQATLEAMKAGVLSVSPGAQPADIPDLGDGAYWVNLGGRRSGVSVNVRHNPRTWLTVSESSSGQEVGLTVDRLTRIARGVLARL